MTHFKRNNVEFSSDVKSSAKNTDGPFVLMRLG
jgi:hypothetical protein